MKDAAHYFSITVGPCDELKCPLQQQCAENKTACPAFYEFVHRTSWAGKSTTPTQEIYRMLYDD